MNDHHRAIAEQLLERVAKEWTADGVADVFAESAEDRGRILAAQAHATLATIPDDRAGRIVAELCSMLAKAERTGATAILVTRLWDVIG